MVSSVRGINRNITRKLLKKWLKKEKFSMGALKRQLKDMGEKPTLRNLDMALGGLR
jgi:hypothetical protein